ncbi:hypothetical protein [Streptomyces sp. NBC_00237]|uniref:hypothetical protein n=1 Tax=Streptomyces sp. NBC_00237 TaxID=2975687 RepID=UPI002B1DA280|nr:hypothetical protein [Streptomyces sp. NBC_00237]
MQPHWRSLELGCGTGSVVRETARRSPDGRAVVPGLATGLLRMLPASPEIAAVWGAAFDRLHREAVATELVPVDGVLEALDALRALGLPVCVASSGGHGKPPPASSSTRPGHGGL